MWKIKIILFFLLFIPVSVEQANLFNSYCRNDGECIKHLLMELDQINIQTEINLKEIELKLMK